MESVVIVKNLCEESENVCKFKCLFNAKKNILGNGAPFGTMGKQTLRRIEMTFVTTRGHKDKALISSFKKRVIQSAVSV